MNRYNMFLRWAKQNELVSVTDPTGATQLNPPTHTHTSSETSCYQYTYELGNVQNTGQAVTTCCPQNSFT